MKRAGLFMFFAVLALCIGLPGKAFGQKTSYEAYSIYLYNLMKYTEWPAESFKNNEVVIYVLGTSSKIVPELEKMAKSRTLSNRKIILKKADLVSDIKSDCNILYITAQKSPLIGNISAQLKNLPVLIVAEREGLARKGACVSFFRQENETLGFAVSKKTLEARGLKMSNRLLNLGETVD